MNPSDKTDPSGSGSIRIVTLVVPVFNEESMLARLIAAVDAAFQGLAERHEVLLVDDGSHDLSWKAIEALCAVNPHVKGVGLSRNFGKEAAISAGLEAATGDAVVVMDADLQHSPDLLPEMLAPWREGRADVVEAVRINRQAEPLSYRLCAGAFYALAKRLTGLRLDGASDFKLLDRRVVSAYRQLGERNLFFRGMAAWLGFRRVQVPFEAPIRDEGRSRWTFKQLVELSLTGITAFTSLPLRLVTMIGVVFLAFALVVGVRAILVKLSGHVIDGITLLILINLIIGSAVMISLGVMGEYIARIYIESKQRPRYLVARRCNLK